MRKLLFILFSWILISCNRTQTPLPSDLGRAEFLMQTYPDSALAILDTMCIPSPSDRMQYATWCLLRTQAQTKNNIKPTSDSLINIALSYFEKGDDIYKKAITLYYKGRVEDDFYYQEEATNYYLKAESTANKIQEEKGYRLLLLIYSSLGQIYEYRHLNDLALSAYEDAYNYARQIQDSTYISIALSQQGKISSRLARWDSAIYYYSNAIQISEQAKDLKTTSISLAEIGFVYSKLKQYTSAIDNLKKGEEIIINNKLTDIDRIYLCLGHVYTELEKYDSASIYLTKALQTNNIERIKQAYQSLYLLNEKQKKFKEAVMYNNLYSNYADSIAKITQTREVFETSKKYDQKELLNEQEKLRFEKEKLEKGFLHLVIFIICILGAILYFCQSRLLKKERSIQQVKSEIESYRIQIFDNEEIISKNELIIQSISQQLEESGSLKEQITEQKNRIKQICQNNECLQEQNRDLLEKLKHYNQTLEENDETVHIYNKLIEQNNLLKNREKALSEYMLQQLELFKRLKEAPKYIEEQEWSSIQEAVNILYNNFTQRLHQDFPALTDNDLQICSLLKLKFTTSSIAVLTSVSPSSITKRKQRIKERMSLQQPEIWAEESSLEMYFWKY